MQAILEGYSLFTETHTHTHTHTHGHSPLELFA